MNQASFVYSWIKFLLTWNISCKSKSKLKIRILIKKILYWTEEIFFFWNIFLFHWKVSVVDVLTQGSHPEKPSKFVLETPTNPQRHFSVYEIRHPRIFQRILDNFPLLQEWITLLRDYHQDFIWTWHLTTLFRSRDTVI